MSSLRAVLVIGFAIVSAPVPALACVVAMPWNPAEVKQAEVVVMGRLTGYGIIPVRRNPSEKGWSGGHAEFDLTVDHVLVGETPRRIRVKWHNSTFSKPAEMADGRYLVALFRPRPGDGETFMVFQRPCSGAFLLKSGSSASMEVLRVLAGVPPYVPPPPPPDPLPSTDVPAPAMPAAYSSWHSPWPEDPPIPKVYWIAIGLVAISFAVAIGALVWRPRRRREARPDDDLSPPADRV